MHDQEIIRRARDLARWARHWYDESNRQYAAAKPDDESTRKYWGTKAHVLGSVLYALGGLDKEEFEASLKDPKT